MEWCPLSVSSVVEYCKYNIQSAVLLSGKLTQPGGPAPATVTHDR